MAAPKLSMDIKNLTNTPENQTLLVAINNHYLSPLGELARSINSKNVIESNADVRPLFEHVDLETFIEQSNRSPPKKRLICCPIVKK